MEQAKIRLLIIAFLATCFLKPAFAENKNTNDSQGVSVELRFVCEKPESNCIKLVNEDNKEELFLEKQPQFTIKDLGLARVVFTDITGFKTREDKRKSLILKGKEEKPEPLAEIITYFTEEAKGRLAKVTSENMHRRLGIVIDGRLVMAPKILEPITEGEVKISGSNLTKKYTEDLVSRINAITKIDEEEVKNIFLRGLFFNRQGMYDDAIAQFNKVIHINPNRAEAYGNRAIAYYYKKEYAKSWDDVHKTEGLGLNMMPEFLEALKKASGREK